jgi:hypothetical protein
MVMDESNPHAAPRTPLSWLGDPRIRATALGGVGIACAMLGLLAFVGYGWFATRGIYAAHARNMVAAHRMASFAGGFSLAQLPLGLLAIGLGWGATTRARGTALAKGLGASAVGLGVVVLLLLFVLV